MGSKKKSTVGHEYSFGCHHGVSRARNDELLAIKVGDRVAWEGSVTENATIQIDKPDLFGGPDKEGGIVCAVDVMFGAPDQVVNTKLAAMLAGLVSAFRGVTTLFSDGLMCSGGPYPKPWSHRWVRTHMGWDNDEVWYPEKARIDMLGPNGEPIKAANPAHILYQLHIDRDWGRGLARARLDDAAWRAAADTLYAEGFGLCLRWTRKESLTRFRDTVVDHIGAALGGDPNTGLVVLRLIRDDYIAGSLPLFDADSGLLEMEDDDAGSQATGINEVVVNYVSPVDGKGRSVRVKNAAAIHALAGVSSVTNEYPGIPTAELALRVAQRDLRAGSGFIKRFKVRLDRRGYAIVPGAPFRIRDLSRGIDNIVLRAGRVEHSPIAGGSVTITALQDVFGLPATSYVDVQPGGYVPPVTEPFPIVGGRLLEAPYRDLAALLDPFVFDQLDDTAAFVAGVGPAPNAMTLGYELVTRVGTSGPFVLEAEGACCPAAELALAIGPADTEIELTAALGLADVALGSAVLLGDEICRVEALDAGALTATLARGCADTVPRAHAAGTSVLFYDGYAAAGETQYESGLTIQAKLLTLASAGTLSEGAAATLEVLLQGRQGLPYPPGDLRINGERFPAAVNDSVVSLEWAHRDRGLQLDQLVDTLATDIGPEAGTTYSVELRNAGTNALLVAASGIPGNTYTSPTLPAGIYDLRIQVWAVREGLASYQRHDVTAAFSFALHAEVESQVVEVVASMASAVTAMVVSASTFQDAASESAGSRYIGNYNVVASITGVTQPLPHGVNFTLVFQLPIGTTVGSITYTTVENDMRVDVYDGLNAAMTAHPTLPGLGYAVGTEVPPGLGFAVGYILGPEATPNVFVASPPSGEYYCGVSVQHPGSAAVPEDLPQIVDVTFSGTAAEGDLYRITLAGVAFEHEGEAGDTPTTVAAALAALIDAHASYSASAAAGVVTIEGQPAVDYTYAATATAVVAYVD